MKTAKLYVGISDVSLDLLKHIDRHIIDILSMGIKIDIEKIVEKEMDTEDVQLLAKKGVVRLPTLLSPGGTPYVGIDAILKLINDSIKKSNLRGGPSQGNGEWGGRSGGSRDVIQHGDIIGTNTDLSDFYAREMYQMKDGKREARTDKDDNMDDRDDDISAKMRQYERNVPKHRRSDEQRDMGDSGRGRRERHFDDDDEDERPRGRGRDRGRRDRSESPPPRRQSRGRDRSLSPSMEDRERTYGDTNVASSGDSAMDDKILSAWNARHDMGGL